MNEFLRSILDGINSVIGNYGWSIIVFTLLIRLVLMPFDAKSRKSMRKMSTVQPMQAALQKKYANDKDKLNQKMAELYKKEKINPLSSCLPMLLTMPVLFAMFAAMRMIANEQIATQFLTLLGGGTPAYEPWLWIKNIWMPDSPFAAMVPDAASLNLIPLDIWQHTFANLADGIRAALPADITYDFANNDTMRATVASMLEYIQTVPTYTDAFKAAPGLANLNLILTKITIYVQHNGLFILPILAAGSQMLMTKVNPAATGAQPQPGANGQQQPNTMGFMKWFFPIFSLFICSSQNAGFSIYWVAANLIMTVQTFALNKYFDMQEQNKKTAVEGEGSIK
jgi:membrane protein insertase, YidC/Oxa1 family, C-terminal domain